MTLKHILGNLPVIRILDFMIDNQAQDHTKKDIAEGAEIGPTAMKTDFTHLVECGVVCETRKIAGVGLYTLDVTNAMTTALIQFDETLTDYCTEKILAVEDEYDEEYAPGLPEPED